MSYQQRPSTLSKIDLWIESPRRNPRAECRLYCLPYAGGSGAIFRTWQKSLPETIEVVPLHLPGRGRRMKEPPLRNLMQMARTVVDDLLPVFRQKPFAFYGHSMGATISYEVARILRDERGPQPLALIVTGRQAPHLPDTFEPTYQLPQEEFVAQLRRLNGTPQAILDSAELMELMIPVLRSDFEAIETYVYQPAPPLDCPIFAFGGDQDADIKKEDIEAWGQHTKGEFKAKMFSGDHFFLHPQEQALLSEVGRELERCRRASVTL